MVRLSADVSEEPITFIFRVENEPRKKTASGRWAVAQKMATSITTAVTSSDLA
jgi:hypothetical protein